LAKQYGNVYSLFIGSRPTVIVNGAQALKEALINKAADFAGRPQNILVNHAVVLKGVVLADYSTGWKEQRRFGLMTLRNFGLGKESMEQRILKAIQPAMKLLEQNVGKSMNPKDLFHKVASNIISQVLFGKQYDYEDEFFKFYLRLFQDTSKIINGRWGMIYDSLPMVRKLPLPFQKAFKLFKIAHEKNRALVTDIKATRVSGKPRHIIDAYLDEIDKRADDGSSFSEDQLSAIVLDLHFAGTDTTANTLLTALLYLMNHPQIQERCYQEIDRILNGKDQVSFEDRHQMPYVQAVIHEIQRVADTVPLAVFHRTTRDTELMGYSIPKGTTIIVNLSSLLHEEGQWKFPHEFNPENFLNEQGEFVKPEAFMPFSAGPRMCLGEGLARMELFLITVTLLRKFQFIWPEDAGEPDYVPIYSLSQTPKPYHMKVQLRGKITIG
ncbi:hypothetical protein LDENG_00273630, partial [Lucifuga dentata]